MTTHEDFSQGFILASLRVTYHNNFPFVFCRLQGIFELCLRLGSFEWQYLTAKLNMLLRQKSTKQKPKNKKNKRKKDEIEGMDRWAASEKELVEKAFAKGRVCSTRVVM